MTQYIYSIVFCSKCKFKFQLYSIYRISSRGLRLNGLVNETTFVGDHIYFYMEFNGLNYVVVGGTSGIGFAVSVALKEAGARVLVFGKDDEFVEECQKSLAPECLIITGDACSPDDIEKAIRIAGEELGEINGLLHVAGGSGRRFGDGPLHEMTMEGWNKTIELNLTSVMISNRAIINYFLANNKGGSIVNIGSVLSESPTKEYFSTHAYAASKSAIIGFTKSIASYYAIKNIRANVVSPALVETPMSKRAMNNDKIMSFIKTKMPLGDGGFANAGDLISPILMFLSPASKMVTGQVLNVDGGWGVSDGQYEK